MDKIKIILTLTEKQADLLSEALHAYMDRGPGDGGWQSPPLHELRDSVDAAIRSAPINEEGGENG